MLEKIRRLLASPRAPYIAAFVAVLLTLPTLRAGLFMDDLTHRATFAHGFWSLGGPQAPFDIFRFQGPDRGYFHHNLDIGLFPWWTAPSFQLALFRPLSSLLHTIDYKLWPGSPWIMHAESIAIYGIMALFAGLLYQRHIRPAWAAGLAALFFAMDDAHSMVVVWIANRNAILAGMFGVAAIWAHDRGRAGSKREAVLAPFLLALGLLSGESALAAGGYIAAHAAFLDEAPIRARIKSLLPYAGVGLVWLLLYKGLGYGGRGGGMYIDPGAEPIAYLRAFAERVPLLLLAQLGVPPADTWTTVPHGQLGPVAAVSALVLAFMGAVIYRIVKGDRAARFFTAGLVLSVVPAAATWPSDRLLVFAGLGGFGLVAVFLGNVGEALGRVERLFAKVIAASFILIHGIVAPILLPLRSEMIVRTFGDYIERADSSMPSDPGLNQATIVILNAPDVFVATYPMAVRFYEGRPLPKAVRQLAIVASGRAEVTRVDDHTIAMTQSEGFIHDVISPLFRGSSVPFHAGDIVEVAGMRAEVAEILPDGRPRKVLFRFDDPLDSNALRWIRWEVRGYVPVKPPAPGETLVVEPIDYMKVLTSSKD